MPVDVSPKPMIEPAHLGDGAYVRFDGYYFWLYCDRENGRHEVALEPHSIAALMEYRKAALGY